MSSEVCPYCGKSYKRLKSHLSHCKAAPTSKTAASRHDVTANEPTSPSQLDSNVSKTTGKGKKTVAASIQAKKDEKLSESLQPLTSSTSSPPISSKKKKLKVADQIKTIADLSSSPPPSSSATPLVSKTKKKSLRALIEAANFERVAKKSIEGAQNPSEDLDLSRNVKAGMDSSPHEDSFESFSADKKAKDVLKNKKVLKSKKAGEFQSATLDSKANKSSTSRPRARENFWVESDEEVQDLSADAFLLKTGGGEEAKITLQNVKATLGRAKSSSKLKTTDNLTTAPSPVTSEKLKDAVRNVEPVTLISPILSQAQVVKKKTPQSKKTALISPLNDAFPQLLQTSPAHPLLPPPLPSQRRPAAPPPPPPPPPPVVSLTEGLKVGHHEGGLLSKSPLLSQFSSPLHFPPVPQTKAASGEKLQLEVRRPNTSANPTGTSLAQQRLGEVKLRELPEWLALRTPSHPREVVEIVQRGWQWYYRRYIDVKKGGVGGLSMLLAGYCVLSYIWSFPHIKHDRWRKYH